MSIQMTVSGARVSFPKWLFKPMAATWRSRVAPIVLEAIKAEAPEYKYDDTKLSRGQKKGDLKKSIKLDSTSGSLGAGIEMVFVSDAPYAGYVVSGTRRHNIPSTGFATNPMLHWQRSGEDFFRFSVDHPGTSANNFPKRAVEKVQPVIGRTLELTVSEYIKPEQL
jgi:hypothetical protein